MNQKIILASASPRRRELLAQIGLDFQVIVSNVEERVTAEAPGEIVEELSRQKAEGILSQGLEQNVIIIGADTIVYCCGQVLGKPKDEEDAKGMLRMLQGRTHEVYTGVTLLEVPKESDGILRRVTFHESAKVHFYPMSEAEIAEYVATGEPSDKAGAYGVQGRCARYIRGIEGEYNTVVGLPVGRLYQELKRLGGVL